MDQQITGIEKQRCCPPGATLASMLPWRAVRLWLACRRGASAVEFALLAPTLAFCLLATVDLGMALTERMLIDHVLRSGAQMAIGDPGPTVVSDLMEDTAEPNFALSDADSPTPLTLAAQKFCACPESPDVAVACSTSCADSEPTFIFYRMTAQKVITGRIVPDLTIDRAVKVHIR